MARKIMSVIKLIGFMTSVAYSDLKPATCSMVKSLW